MHLNSGLVFKEHAAAYIRDGARVLEIGPDRRPSTYQKLATPQVSEWVTTDIEGSLGAYIESEVDIIMAGEYNMPFDDASLDVVVSGNVLEHVREPWRWMREAARVTKPGGVVITVAPISWPYHPAPVDCFRFFPDGMDSLCRYAGLQPIVSWFGSLETPQTSRPFPGISTQGHGVPHVSSWKKLVFRAIGWPRPVAIDVVSVGRKPAAAG